MNGHLVPAVAALAAALLGGTLGGRLARLARIPKVTGYLVVGLLAGPSTASLLDLSPLISKTALVDLRLVSEVALALIMMTIGAQFQIQNLRRWKGRILVFSAGEAGVTFLVVALSCFAVNGLLVRQAVGGYGVLATSLWFALLLGIIAVATAPAATLMVIREYGADGPVTGTVLTLVGLNNLVSVMAFAVLAHPLLRPGEGVGSLVAVALGPLAAGAVIGFVISLWAQRVDQSNEQKLLLLGGVLGTLGVCRWLGLDPLLASLAMGVVLANSSPRWTSLAVSLREIDYPLYVVFFVMAGASLHLETLGNIGLLGVAYVAARTAGKLLGARLGADFGKFGERERSYAGMALMAQAGVAIGLASSLSRAWPEGGHLVETVVLGAVVIFELVGPLAVRRGLVGAGEVPLLSMLSKKAPENALEGMHTVVQHFRATLGLPAGHRCKDPGDILVRHVMRQNVDAIRHDTPFNEILRLISHSKYDRFPVVDEGDRFIGIIDYQEIRNLLFEPSLARLVVASDLVSPPEPALEPDQPLREALKILEQHRNITFFPVVDPAVPDRLLGILSQNDVLATFRRGRR